MFRSYIDVVGSPPRTVIDSLDDTRALKPAMQGETGKEPILARIQTCEPNARDTDQARLLRNHLNVTQRIEYSNVIATELDNLWFRFGEERLQCESPARVPHVAGN